MKRTRLCVVVALLVACSGCTFPIQRAPNDWMSASPLADNKGILLIYVDTDFRLQAFDTSAGRIELPDESGQYMVFVELPAGTYVWKYLEAEVFGFDWRWKLWPWKWGRDPTFTVEAGYVNYPGAIEVEQDPRYANWISVRPYNDSAQMLLRLEREYPELLDRYPLRWSGPDRDEFLDQLRAARLESP